MNYIQNFSEQWKCKTIILESQESDYGYVNGKKEASPTGAFPDVPGVCPTPNQKSVTKEEPKEPLKKSPPATDITAATRKENRNQKRQAPRYFTKSKICYSGEEPKEPLRRSPSAPKITASLEKKIETKKGKLPDTLPKKVETKKVASSPILYPRK